MENVSADKEMMFSGNYTNDRAKGIGKVTDSKGNVYKGCF